MRLMTGATLTCLDALEAASGRYQRPQMPRVILSERPNLFVGGFAGLNPTHARTVRYPSGFVNLGLAPKAARATLPAVT